MSEKIKVVLVGGGGSSKGKSRLVEMAIEGLKRLHGEENVEVVTVEGDHGLRAELIEVDGWSEWKAKHVIDEAGVLPIIPGNCGPWINEVW